MHFNMTFVKMINMVDFFRYTCFYIIVFKQTAAVDFNFVWRSVQENVGTKEA